MMLALLMLLACAHGVDEEGWEGTGKNRGETVMRNRGRLLVHGEVVDLPLGIYEKSINNHPHGKYN